MATQGGAELDNKDDLMLNISLRTGYIGLVYLGYKREFITQQLSEMEETLLICSVCSGVSRDACSISGGADMACEVCVGKGEGGQTVGPVRSMVSHLRCRCPLKHRGCAWEGTVGEMREHLGECDQFIVQCPYYTYGCTHQLKRGDKETHRREGKEYHNELMSVFMAERIQQQGEEVKRLQETINQLIEERRYFKLNGVIWGISDGEAIREKLTELTQTAFDGTETISCAEIACNEPASPNSTKRKKKKPSLYIGPKFTLEPSYILFPQLSIDNMTGEVSLYLVSDKANQRAKHLNWPIEGTCRVFLINQQSNNETWVLDTEAFSLPYGDTVKLTNIPPKFLIADAYNNKNNIELKLLFKIEQTLK